MSVLSIKNLSKNYGFIKALQDVSFDVPKGTIFGILGPNGSGKTTLLGIAMNVLKASGGSFSWNGEDGSSNLQRQKIGTLLETPNFYHYLSAQKNLEIAAEIKGRNKDDIARVLEIVNLSARKDHKFSTYSLGMKQRLAIASALLGNPDTLVFDEPTNGLDPAGIAEIRELMIKLRNDGKTIIMASHILDEVERVCSHVAIIQKGVLKTVGTVHDVLNTSNSATNVDTVEIELAAENMEALRKIIKEIAGYKSVAESNSAITLTADATTSAATINAHCMQQGIVLSHLVLKKKSLESRFLEITGKTSDR